MNKQLSRGSLGLRHTSAANCFRLAVKIPATLSYTTDVTGRFHQRFGVWGQPDKLINSALACFFAAS